MGDLVKESYNNLLAFTKNEKFMQKLKIALNHVNILDFSSRSLEVLNTDIKYWYEFYDSSTSNQGKIKALNDKLYSLMERATVSNKSTIAVVVNDDLKDAKFIINILGDMISFFGDRKKTEGVNDKPGRDIELLNFIRLNYQEINSFIESYKKSDVNLKNFTAYIDEQKVEVSQAKEKTIKEITSDAEAAIKESQAERLNHHILKLHQVNKKMKKI